MLQMLIFQINAFVLNFFIKEPQKTDHGLHKNIKKQKLLISIYDLALLLAFMKIWVGLHVYLHIIYVD